MLWTRARRQGPGRDRGGWTDQVYPRIVGREPLGAVRRRVVAVALVGTLGLGGCGSDGSGAGGREVARSTSTASTTSTSRPEVDPGAYLAEVERLVRAHAYYADRIDWSAWEADASAVAAQANRSSDTYETIDRLLTQLDPHSGLSRPVGTSRSGDEHAAPGPLPAVTVDDGIGRIVLPLAPWGPRDGARSRLRDQGLGRPRRGGVRLDRRPPRRRQRVDAPHGPGPPPRPRPGRRLPVPRRARRLSWSSATTARSPASGAQGSNRQTAPQSSSGRATTPSP